MWKANPDALLCDFAETYHLYDIHQLPLSTVAVLACGLRPDSRSMMALQGQEMGPETLLLYAIRDYLALIWWSKTKGAEKGRNRPKLLLEEVSKERTERFTSGKEFEKRLQQFNGNEG